jgi:hypothetical protein
MRNACTIPARKLERKDGLGIGGIMTLEIGI